MPAHVYTPTPHRGWLYYNGLRYIYIYTVFVGISWLLWRKLGFFLVEDKHTSNPLGCDFKPIEDSIENLALYASSSRSSHAFVVLHILRFRSKPFALCHFLLHLQVYLEFTGRVIRKLKFWSLSETLFLYIERKEAAYIGRE